MDAPFVAVVTGSSSGIGRATAIAFARKNAFVQLHGNSNLAGLYESSRLTRSSTEDPSASLVHVVDLTCSDSARAMMECAFAQFGYVDAWVNAAGADVLTGDARQRSFSEKLDALLKLDVASTMRLSRWVAQRMQCQPARSQLPSIVHIGWDQSEHGMEGDSGQYFCAVKAAITAFSKSLAKTFAPHVRVNCVAPGWIQTEWGNQVSSPWQERATGESMLNRWGTPQDVANAIVALCSKELEFINGQTIAVNGGWQSMQLSARCQSTAE
ncbi:MAG: SDR family NAD(P)-dependent oxidoreductase [Pirellula sp.]|jgi:3-oxoacyl-[acyl-carrier protein] reductase